MICFLCVDAKMAQPMNHRDEEVAYASTDLSSGPLSAQNHAIMYISKAILDPTADDISTDDYDKRWAICL